MEEDEVCFCVLTCVSFLEPFVQWGINLTQVPILGPGVSGRRLHETLRRVNSRGRAQPLCQTDAGYAWQP